MTSNTSSSQIGCYVLGKKLGKGHTSTVRLGKCVTNPKMTSAIKIIDQDYIRGRESRWGRIRREIAILKLVRHPNILSLYSLHEDSENFYIALEYAKGGELFDYIIESNPLGENEAMRLLGQLVSGLEYLHSFGICHRDLKPENLLLDENKNIKIADFGFAQVCQTWEHVFLRTNVGSPHYAAPEIISGEWAYDGKISDVWSIGIILYAMVTCLLPFDDPNMSNLVKMVSAGAYLIPDTVSPLVRDLIARMLTVNPEKRIQMHNIRRHAAFKHLCPTMYVDAPWENVQSTSLDFINHSPLPDWDANKSLDKEILEDMESLGWGDIKTLNSTLTDDLSNSSKTNEIPRLDRALYLTFEKQKILRKERFDNLTNPKSIEKELKQKVECKKQKESKVEIKMEEKSKREGDWGQKIEKIFTTKMKQIFSWNSSGNNRKKNNKIRSIRNSSHKSTSSVSESRASGDMSDNSRHSYRCSSSVLDSAIFYKNEKSSSFRSSSVSGMHSTHNSIDTENGIGSTGRCCF